MVQLTGYVNATPDFTQLSEMVNGASELTIEVFGGAGHHARTAIGAVVMLFGVAIEVEARFLLR